MDAVNKTLPLPREIIPGKTARVSACAPRTCVFNTRKKSSEVVSTANFFR